MSDYGRRIERKKITPAQVKEIRERAAAATKHDHGKNRIELIPSAALIEVAKVFTKGAEKYSDNNWREGFNWSRLQGAIQRHLHAWNTGENLDPEFEISHLAHAACGLLMLLEHELQGLGKDDRYKYEQD